MNYYKLQGQITRWTAHKLSQIGFKNVQTYAMSDNEFRILLKDGNQYVVTMKIIRK